MRAEWREVDRTPSKRSAGRRMQCWTCRTGRSVLEEVLRGFLFMPLHLSSMCFLCKAQSHFLEADVSRLKQRGSYSYLLQQPDYSSSIGGPWQ